VYTDSPFTQGALRRPGQITQPSVERAAFVGEGDDSRVVAPPRVLALDKPELGEFSELLFGADHEALTASGKLGYLAVRLLAPARCGHVLKDDRRDAFLTWREVVSNPVRHEPEPNQASPPIPGFDPIISGLAWRAIAYRVHSAVPSHFGVAAHGTLGQGRIFSVIDLAHDAGPGDVKRDRVKFAMTL
jgi:hypothetical protein